MNLTFLQIFLTTQRSILRAMCRVQLKDRKRAKYLMLMLGLNETIGQLALANCELVWLYFHERGWSCLAKGIEA